MYELKSLLKSLAADIRTAKISFKQYQREHSGSSDYKLLLHLEKSKYDFRHKHIAYCLLRGRTYEQIERKCNVQPNWDFIKVVQNDFREPIIEDVCASA
jgi:phage portal protein BeeE